MNYFCNGNCLMATETQTQRRAYTEMDKPLAIDEILQIYLNRMRRT